LNIVDYDTLILPREIAGLKKERKRERERQRERERERERE